MCPVEGGIFDLGGCPIPTWASPRKVRGFIRVDRLRRLGQTDAGSELFCEFAHFWSKGVLLFMWIQRTLRLTPFRRGFHLITDQVVDAVPELSEVSVGLMHVFIQHTSASLTINENADPDVRIDFETAMNHAVPESLRYVHTIEGPDDMPAHVKASMMGASVTMPVGQGRLSLGTWQGIYLCEHRNSGGSRRLVITVHGEARQG